jgi:hypothetical protein
MAERRRRRNPYRRGSPSYERQRQADLSRRRALAEARAARATTSDARRRAQRQAAEARRGIRISKARREVGTAQAEFRAGLNWRDRMRWDRLPAAKQRLFIEERLKYPQEIPYDVPDPFLDNPSQRRQYRGQLWTLDYATRAAMRQRRVA